MAKKLRYRCSQCQHEETGWTGKCPACDSWGTMEEIIIDTSKKKNKAGRIPSSQLEAKPLSQVEINMSQRIDTNMDELNRVLGGGLVKDSVTMLTAKPGAGKSTLLLQLAGQLAEKGIRVLYASGEESSSQIKARALRVLPRVSDSIYILSTNSMDVVINELERIDPQVIFIDSVQTMALDEFSQRQGTPTQTVQVTSALVDICKRPNKARAAFLVGHMTKEDEMAGLRTLEHLVDTVLYLDQGNDENLRMLRSTKNRFGYTGEVGLFQMEENGLNEVKDPYDLFLTKREDQVPGSAISLQKEGSRLIPIEIEALVSDSYGTYPSRIGDSIKRDDLNTLISILEQKANFQLSNKNVVLKATGGLAIQEKVSDLAIIAGIASSDHNKAIPGKTAFLAEVGLTGELKRVSQIERRLRELERIGFETAYVSKNTKIPDLDRLKVFACNTIQEVFNQIFYKD